MPFWPWVMNMIASLEHFSHYDHLISGAIKYSWQEFYCKCLQRICEHKNLLTVLFACSFNLLSSIFPNTSFKTPAAKILSLKKLNFMQNPQYIKQVKVLLYWESTFYPFKFLTLICTGSSHGDEWDYLTKPVKLKLECQAYLPTLYLNRAWKLLS